MQHSNDFNTLCDQVKQQIQEITASEMRTILATSNHIHLIDVRDQDEFAAGHIEGATHLSKGWIEAKIHHIVNQKDDKVILYCGGGNRSALAADNLQKMGYTHVYSLIGGYKGWKAYSV